MDIGLFGIFIGIVGGLIGWYYYDESKHMEIFLHKRNLHYDYKKWKEQLTPKEKE